MKKKKKNIKKSLMHILGGTVLTDDFFMKNTRFIITLIVILILQISNRYTCIERLENIERLQNELKREKYESLTISAKLISVSRSSRVKQLVEQHGLELEEPKSPIYKIEK